MVPLAFVPEYLALGKTKRLLSVADRERSYFGTLVFLIFDLVLSFLISITIAVVAMLLSYIIAEITGSEYAQVMIVFLMDVDADAAASRAINPNGGMVSRS
jgi:hypothetical protein